MIKIKKTKRQAVSVKQYSSQPSGMKFPLVEETI